MIVQIINIRLFFILLSRTNFLLIANNSKTYSTSTDFSMLGSYSHLYTGANKNIIKEVNLDKTNKGRVQQNKLKLPQKWRWPKMKITSKMSNFIWSILYENIWKRLVSFKGLHILCFDFNNRKLTLPEIIPQLYIQ